jgi:hypothetical protein
VGDPIPNVEVGLGKVRHWLELARAKSEKCFICARVASENLAGEGTLRPIKISGIEISTEVQLSHLARCVGDKDGGGT